MKMKHRYALARINEYPAIPEYQVVATGFATFDEAVDYANTLDTSMQAGFVFVLKVVGCCQYGEMVPVSG